jgi:tRNA threonylcarbamoyl adenosine modification protein (Sua5/YciO/YrdC/YwlC family)
MRNISRVQPLGLKWPVMAELIKIHPLNPQSRLIREIATRIEDGGIVAYPTDSSYAFGWAMGDKAAQERIRRLKNLDKHHHFTLVCPGLSELASYARVDNQAYRLLKALTPGPYTFILPATRQVPNRLQHPKRKSIGIRVPDHAIALALLVELSEPLMSTTLQLPGQDEPMNEAWEIMERLQHELVAVVDGGPCALASTSVIDLTGQFPRVTRAGLGDVTHLQSA